MGVSSDVSPHPSHPAAPERDATSAAAQNEDPAPGFPGPIVADDNDNPPPVVHKFHARNISLVVLTVLAVLFALKSAHDFVVPLVLAAVIAYALDPIVAFLERFRVPRVLGTLLIMCAILGGLAYAVLAMEDQVVSIVNTLPEISRQVSRSLSNFASDDGSVLDKLRTAAAVFQNGGKRGPVPEGAAVSIDSLIWAGSMGIATFLAQATMVTFLVFFLLLSGNTFKRKFVKVAGHTLSEKKISVHMLDEINLSIQRYLLMMLVTNVALAILSYIAFKWIGLANAGTWAVLAGALHIIPYFGPLIVAICTGVAAIIQFGDVGTALLVAGASVAIAVLIGIVMTTWMSGRIARMNAVAVFIVLLLFTWMWGVWGTLLSIPIAFIAKVIADHIEGMEGIAEFLGD